MEELENVVEAENTEQPVEQVVELTDNSIEEAVRTYTDEDVNRIIAKKLARQEAKLARQYEEQLSKYKQTEEVLKAGLGTETIDEANERLAEFYREQGVSIPEVRTQGLSSREIEILAKVEAEEIIELGISEMEEEANKLAAKGYENLNFKEKAIFNTLAERLTNENKRKELSKNGIKEDILNDNEFKKFSEKFNPKTSIVDIYNLYTKTQPKIEVKPIGSMATIEVNKVKDFYTMDEINSLTSKDYDDPAVMKAVEKSLEKIYKDSHS